MSTTVRVVSVEVVPSAGSEAAEHASGAQANVFLLAATDGEALSRARQELSDAGWSPIGESELRLVDRHSFEPGSSGLGHYEQCLQDGVVVVLHTWREDH